jgi:hypothetical protein
VSVPSAGTSRVPTEPAAQRVLKAASRLLRVNSRKTQPSPCVHEYAACSRGPSPHDYLWAKFFPRRYVLWCAACSSCTSSISCNSCRANMMLSLGTCACASGMYWNGGSCVPCHFSCAYVVHSRAQAYIVAVHWHPTFALTFKLCSRHCRRAYHFPLMAPQHNVMLWSPYCRIMSYCPRAISTRAPSSELSLSWLCA